MSERISSPFGTVMVTPGEHDANIIDRTPGKSITTMKLSAVSTTSTGGTRAL
ncbi:MAG: hypothetical protein AAFU56_07355 [Pseudomonadota bacterium]